MARHITDHGQPDRFVTGTVGPPGERTFFLQSRKDGVIVSVQVEKEQVVMLSNKVIELLDLVARQHPDVEQPGPKSEDSDPLDVPIEPAFIAGAFGLGWDPSKERVVLEIHAEGENIPDVGEDDKEGPECLRVWLTPQEAREFVQRSSTVVSAGRPLCPFCQLPLDPDGHICPRANGFRR